MSEQREPTCRLCLGPAPLDRRQRVCGRCRRWFLRRLDDFHANPSTATCPVEPDGLGCGLLGCSPCKLANLVALTGYSLQRCTVAACCHCRQPTVCATFGEPIECSACRPCSEDEEGSDEDFSISVSLAGIPLEKRDLAKHQLISKVEVMVQHYGPSSSSSIKPKKASAAFPFVAQMRMKYNHLLHLPHNDFQKQQEARPALPVINGKSIQTTVTKALPATMDVATQTDYSDCLRQLQKLEQQLAALTAQLAHFQRGNSSPTNGDRTSAPALATPTKSISPSPSVGSTIISLNSPAGRSTTWWSPLPTAFPFPSSTPPPPPSPSSAPLAPPALAPALPPTPSPSSPPPRTPSPPSELTEGAPSLTSTGEPVNVTKRTSSEELATRPCWIRVHRLSDAELRVLGVATATSKPRRRLASETEGTEEPASKRRRTESSNEGDTPAASFGETLLEADADAKEATRSRKRSRHPKTQDHRSHKTKERKANEELKKNREKEKVKEKDIVEDTEKKEEVDGEADRESKSPKDKEAEKEARALANDTPRTMSKKGKKGRSEKAPEKAKPARYRIPRKLPELSTPGTVGLPPMLYDPPAIVTAPSASSSPPPPQSQSGPRISLDLRSEPHPLEGGERTTGAPADQERPPSTEPSAPSDPRAEDGVHRPAPKSLLRLYWPKQQLGVQNQKRVTFDLPQSTDEDTGCLDNPNSPPFRQFGDGSPTSSTGSPTAMEPSFSALERQSVANEWQRAAVEPLSGRDNPNFEAANDSSVVLQRLVGSEKGLLWTLERQSFAKGRPHGDVEQSVDSIKQFVPGPLTKSASSRRWFFSDEESEGRSPTPEPDSPKPLQEEQEEQEELGEQEEEEEEKARVEDSVEDGVEDGEILSDGAGGPDVGRGVLLERAVPTGDANSPARNSTAKKRHQTPADRALNDVENVEPTATPPLRHNDGSPSAACASAPSTASTTREAPSNLSKEHFENRRATPSLDSVVEVKVENHDADDDDDILDLGLDESETFADEPSSPPKPSAPVKNPTPVPSQAPPSIIENRHHAGPSVRTADVARSGADAQQLCYRFIGTGQCKGPSFGCRYSNEQHSHGPDVITRHMELLLQYGHLEHANKLLECLLNDKSPMRSRLLEDWGVRLTNSFVQHLLRVGPRGEPPIMFQNRALELLAAALRFLTTAEIQCTGALCHQVMARCFDLRPRLGPPIIRLVNDLFRRVDRENIRVSADVWNQLLVLMGSATRDWKLIIDSLEKALKQHPTFQPDSQTFEFLFVSVFQKPDELKRICMLALAMDHSPLRQLPVQLKRDIVNVLKGFNMKQLLDNFLLEPFNDLFPGPCESTQVKACTWWPPGHRTHPPPTPFYSTSYPPTPFLSTPLPPTSFPPPLMSFPPPSLPPLGPAPAPAPGPAPRPTPPPEVPVFAPLSPPKAAPKAVLTVQPPPPPAPLLPPSALAEPPPLKERFRAALAANKVDTTVPELIFQHPKELVPELILLLKTQPAPAPLNLIVATITTKVIELDGEERARRALYGCPLVELGLGVLQLLCERPELPNRSEQFYSVWTIMSTFGLPVEELIENVPLALLVYAAQCCLEADDVNQALYFLILFHQIARDVEHIEAELIDKVVSLGADVAEYVNALCSRTDDEAVCKETLGLMQELLEQSAPNQTRFNGILTMTGFD